MNSLPNILSPKNEPILDYRSGSPERAKLAEAVSRMMRETVEIPLVVNGKEVRTGTLVDVVAPHRKDLKLGRSHQVNKEWVQKAIDGSLSAWKSWARTPYTERVAVFNRAAELISTKYRYELNAATMLGQSKTCHQAEIDSACELIDFLRFNSHFLQQIYAIQPESTQQVWNRLEYRPLEGFILAVTPFNFTAIAGNLPSSPALMGNVALWKPASTSVLSNYLVMKIFMEAGLPPGVIQFLPGSGRLIGETAIASPDFAGLHFTGSTEVFQQLWRDIANRMGQMRSYPRLVGETGGKDFIFAHPSAEVDSLVAALIRGAFEYQGQKCSAASRAYIPRSLWSQVRDQLVAELETIKIGDVADFSNFMGAVIDRPAWERIGGYIRGAERESGVELLFGGKCSDEVGYFVTPTVLVSQNPKSRTFCEEIFGPVLTVFVYEDAEWESMLGVCDQTSPYALTGSFIAQDRKAIEIATAALWQSAGNFYINNKCTGAVVGQQPFGGGRASGTNDKAGSPFNLLRWTSHRTISETFVPPTDYRYPFLS